jgi:AcrR family transcriptional regulator
MGQVASSKNAGSRAMQSRTPNRESVSESRTSAEIQSAAVRLFAAKGFSGTSIRDIANEANRSLSVLYYYYSNKEDLLYKIMVEAMQDLLSPAKEVMSNIADPRERIEALIKLHVRDHAKNSLRCIVGDTELRSLHTRHRRQAIAVRDGYERIWQDTISDGLTAGAFIVSDVKIARLALIEMCTSVAEWFKPAGRLSVEEVSDELTKLCVAMLGCR